MSETMNMNSTAAAPHPIVIDAAAKWAREAGAAPASLEEIRLTQNERLLIPFTSSIEEIDLHYLDYPSMRGYTRCNGAGCLLCRIGRTTDKRDLLPVYDVISQTVGVLPVSPNIRPQALRPQLSPVMSKVASGAILLLAVQKLDNYRFSVTELPLQDGADDGAEKIAQFRERCDAGNVSLASIYQQMSNELLATLPEVAIMMKAKGVSA